MADPLFSVGEDVWLVSQERPEYNGEAKVLDVCRMPPFMSDCCQYGYILTIPNLPGKIGWHECALRKRPPPEPTVSFDDVMDGLTDKIVEKVE